MPGPGYWGTTKPPPGVALARGHPLARGLVGAWTFSEQAGWLTTNLATSLPFAAAASPVGLAWQAEAHGAAPTATIAAATPFLGLLPDSSILPTGDCTLVLGYQKTDATLRAAAAIGVVSGAQLGLHLPYSDGVVYWDYGASGGTNRLTASGLTFRNNLWVFTAGAAGMAIWQDGRRVASSGTAVTRASTTSPWRLGTHNGVGTDLAQWWLVLLYARQLPASEIAALTATPFAMFAPPVWRRYFVPSVTVQTAVPISDIAAGTWTASTGTALYAMLDETPASDSDYIQSATTPSSDVAEVRVTSLTDPASSSGHVVRYRARKPS